MAEKDGGKVNTKSCVFGYNAQILGTAVAPTSTLTDGIMAHETQDKVGPVAL